MVVGNYFFMIMTYRVVVFGAVCLLGATPAFAGEIQYGHIDAVKGNSLSIQYKGPSGEQYFVCAADSTECAEKDTAPDLFAKIDGATDYTKSRDGNYAMVQRVYRPNEFTTMFIHTLFDISGDEPELLTIIPYLGSISRYEISRAEDKVVLYGMDGSVVTYTIASKKMTTITPGQSDLALHSLSPHAKYLSAYNYLTSMHRIWHTTTGVEIALPGALPSIVEFSDNEQYAAFTDSKDGYQTLYYADLTETPTPTIKRVFGGLFTVEDYIWYGNELYAIANTASDPYRWVLYRFDPEAGDARIVAENASYGDYMRPIGKYGLSFLQIDGKNTNVTLYDPEADEVRVIAPVKASPASTDIMRTVRTFENGAVGVLYAPVKPDRNADLYVWLHGGPQRQTSFGYHSYLSYAVYDELLEKITETGAYVLKLDYAGSYGHGIAFRDALKNQVGLADVDHVVGAVRELQAELEIDGVYAIGNSYGGYLAPKVLVDEPKLFTAAIAINGVFDWFTLTERIPSTPFTSYFTDNSFGENPSTVAEQYERASVIRHLGNLKNDEPIYIISSTEDRSVPVWQSREFYNVAKALKKNVTMLELPGEDHVIRERESLTNMCEFVADELAIKNLACE